MSPRNRTILRYTLRVAAAALIGYILLAGIVALIQARLIYSPVRTLAASPTDVGLPYRDCSLPSGSETLHGWFIPNGATDRLVLFSHGNGGNISHRLSSLRIWYDLGFSILIYDYAGYGRSTGTPGESATYRDIDAAWRYATQTLGFSPARILLFGRSLGGAVTAALAARVQPMAVILESTFTSMPDLAAHLYWYLPVRLLIRFDYNTLARLKSIQSPILIVHSRDDDLIPYSHARRLFEHAPAPRQLLTLHGDHNRGYLESEKEYRAGLGAFLSSLPRR